MRKFLSQYFFLSNWKVANCRLFSFSLMETQKKKKKDAKLNKRSQRNVLTDLPFSLTLFILVFFVNFSNEQQKEHRTGLVEFIEIIFIKISEMCKNPPFFALLNMSVSQRQSSNGLRRVICGFSSSSSFTFFEVLLFIMICFWHTKKGTPLFWSALFYFIFERKLISIRGWVSLLQANF